MQEISWLTFGISNALSRTVVHFFPSEGNVTAPYLANCELELFGCEGADKVGQDKRVMLEGARLSHPDGVRLEDAFPILKSDLGLFFGLQITISTTQQRVDLSESSCIVEFSSKAYSTRFTPVLLSKSEQADQAAPAAGKLSKPPAYRAATAIRDAYCSSSLIAVNALNLSYKPNVTCATLVDGSWTQKEFIKESISARSVLELSIDESFFQQVEVAESTWGVARARALYCPDPAGENQAYYILYRDLVTRRPLSVCAI